VAYRAHDLLWLDRPGAFEPAGELPDWLDGALLARAPVVVRRDEAPAGRVPVGARGLRRNQRCAGLADAGAVTRCVTPAMLARSLAQPMAGRAGELASAAADWPCVATLLSLAPRLDALDVEWGPAGGAGFWLATGLPVLRPASDLDLLVRSAEPLDPDVLDALGALQREHADGCRLDIQVDTGAGGFALAEYLGGAPRVLLKTARGPLLVADPWRREPVR
jgi:phosphoribosyl-dephospho-CoA transferase